MTEILPLAVLVLMQLLMGLVATAAVGKSAGVAWLLSSRREAITYRQSLGGRLDRSRWFYCHGKRLA